MIGLAMGVGVATMQSGNAEAASCTTTSTGKYCFLGGTWVRVGPIEGCYDIARVPNTDQHPALLRCTNEITSRESLCYNPNNYNTLPGVSGKKVVLSSETPIDDGNLNKETGQAHACVSYEDNCLEDPTSPLCDPADICRNRNWVAQYVLVREFRATCQTLACLDDPATPNYDPETCVNTSLANTEVCSCTAPAGITVEDLQADPNLTINYSCERLDPVTLQGTGQSCGS